MSNNNKLYLFIVLLILTKLLQREEIQIEMQDRALKNQTMKTQVEDELSQTDTGCLIKTKMGFKRN